MLPFARDSTFYVKADGIAHSLYLSPSEKDAGWTLKGSVNQPPKFLSSLHERPVPAHFGLKVVILECRTPTPDGLDVLGGLD